MSFGYGVADAITLIRLTRKIVEGARQVCGEHDDLTKEVSSLHAVLEYLQAETSNPASLINLAEDKRRRELRNHMTGCARHLRTIDSILSEYNDLGGEERSTKKLWQKIRFGNGEVMDLTEIRMNISTYTMAITMSLNLMLLGSQGRVERKLSRQSGDLEGIRESVNLVLAKLTSQSREGSVMKDCSRDEKEFWKSFRRELVKDGYPSTLIRGNKKLLQSYVKELSSRRVLDSPRSRSRTALSTFVSVPEPWRQASIGPNRPIESFVTITTDDNERWTESDFHRRPSGNGDAILPSTAPEQSYGWKPPPVQVEEVLDETAYGTLHGENATAPGDQQEPVGHLEVDPNCYQKRRPEFAPDIAEMAERLAFLEKLTLEQEERLKAADRQLQETNAKQELIAAARAAETKVVESPSEPIESLAEDQQPKPTETSMALVRTQKPEDKHQLDEKAKARALEFASLTPEEKKQMIKFTDCVRRKYVFPFWIAKKWPGMEELIRYSFLHVPVIGPQVLAGRYDLIGPEEEIIMPQAWESTIEPDWEISMHMWPMPDPSLPPPDPSPPPGYSIPWKPGTRASGRPRQPPSKKI